MRIGDRRDAAGRRRRRHLRGRQVGDRPRHGWGTSVRLCAGEVDALRSNARLVPADALHLPAGRPRHRGRVRPRKRRRCRPRRDQAPGRPAAARAPSTGSRPTASMRWSSRTRGPSRCSFPLGVALRRAGRGDRLPAIGHHHDYWWERERFASCVVPEVLEEAFPPDLPIVRHVSINSPCGSRAAASAAASTSKVIPNVFDFDQPRPHRDPAMRRRLRHELGHGRARAARRPADARRAAQGHRAGHRARRAPRGPGRRAAHHPPGRRRGPRLPRRARAAGRARRGPAALRRGPIRAATIEGRPIRPAHSLHDAYLAADLITYPSLYEGFGNALLEALFYGVPVLVNRYPVYVADIAPLGLQARRDRRRDHR